MVEFTKEFKISPEEYQLIFDTCLAHVRGTQSKSTDADGNCTYAGIGCAIAPLLKSPEDVSDTQVLGLVRWYTGIFKDWVKTDDPYFLDAIQEAHDLAPLGDFMPTFEFRMKKIAEDFNLQYSN